MLTDKNDRILSIVKVGPETVWNLIGFKKLPVFQAPDFIKAWSLLWILGEYDSFL